jgi:hypothetical protein
VLTSRPTLDSRLATSTPGDGGSSSGGSSSTAVSAVPIAASTADRSMSLQWTLMRLPCKQHHAVQC